MRGERDGADHESYERCCAGLSPAAAEHRRERDARGRIGSEHEGPRTVKWVVLDLADCAECIVHVELPVARVLDEVVEPGERVQVDRRRAHAKRVAALARERAERNVDEPRGGGDFYVGESGRAGQRQHSVFEVRSRVAGIVPGAGEPNQKLDGRFGRLPVGSARSRGVKLICVFGVHIPSFGQAT
ncbi:MAG TPA: hypothetical protein VFD90_05125 [Gaiellales bacterium]|jgi:hypothetical protein|nr:hypothetical protein [Gaiellales bacterium]